MRKLKAGEKLKTGKGGSALMAPDATMREIIAEVWRTGKPVAIGSGSKIAGVVGEAEIFAALVNPSRG